MPTVPPLLLIGASGRVGRMLCHHWPQGPDHPGLLIAQRGSAPLAKGAFRWSPLDGADGLLAQLSAGPMPKAMLVLAGVTPGPGIDEAALQGNRRVAEACLAAARVAGIARILLASSSAVYGVDPTGRAFDETTTPQPVSAYGRAKLEMESACAGATGIEVCALRIGNVAGADALLAPLTGHKIDPSQPIRIDTFADGAGPLRSYIGAKTLARVLATLFDHPAPLPPVLNLAAPNPVRMEALALAAGWPYLMTPAPATAHQSITLDCGLLNQLCPMTTQDSDPAEMVRQWKASQG